MSLDETRDRNTLLALTVPVAVRIGFSVTSNTDNNNMFGDILTDEAAGLVGGLGMAPGLCIGRGDKAMAQATHGSAPDIAGTGRANPYAMIESARMLIEWLGRRHDIAQARDAAALMKPAVAGALAEAGRRTPDIRGSGTLSDMVAGIVDGLARAAH